MPGHFGYISTSPLPDKFHSRICDALIYNSHHHAIEKKIGDQFYQLLVKDQRECTDGHHQNDQKEIWLDGEMYSTSHQGDAPLQELSITDWMDSLHLIDGYFSAVILDKKKNLIHLITDRFGLKPLYLYQNPSMVSWSTETKSFTIHKKVDLSPDQQSIRFFLDHGFYKNDSTPFQEIRLLPPGSITTVKMENLEVASEKYWDWNLMPQPSTDSFSEAVERARQLLKNAIDKRCFIKDSITVALSGGMDSRYLTHALKDRQPLAFTFGDEDSDDVTLAQKVADTIGVHHQIFECNGDNWLKDKLFSVWRTEGMFSFFELHSSPFIRDFKDYGSVVFNGFGGATWLGGKFLGKKDEKELLTQHMRRRVMQGSIDVGKSLIQRKPYMDHAFLEYILSLPISYRQDYRLFFEMAKKEFEPSLLQIPWENTMTSFSHQKITTALIKMKWPSIRRRLSLMKPAFNYKKWISSPSFQEWSNVWVFHNDLLLSIVGKSTIDEANNQRASLGRLMSTSIWLHQASNIDP